MLKKALVRLLPHYRVRQADTTDFSSVPEYNWGTYKTLEDVLTTKHSKQVAYQWLLTEDAKEGGRTPRLGEEFAKHNPAKIELLILDVDRPKTEATWQEQTCVADDFMELITAVCNEYNLGYALSRSGARLFGLIENPVDPEFYSDYLQQLFEDMESKGFPTTNEQGDHIDTVCKDVSRIFFAPIYSTKERSSNPSHIENWINLDVEGFVNFEPTRAFISWNSNARKKITTRRSKQTKLNIKQPIRKAIEGRMVTYEQYATHEIIAKYPKHEWTAFFKMPEAYNLLEQIPFAYSGERNQKMVTLVGSLSARAPFLSHEEAFQLLWPCLENSESDQSKLNELELEINHMLDRFLKQNVQEDATDYTPNFSENPILKSSTSAQFYVLNEETGEYVGPTTWDLGNIQKRVSENCPNVVKLDKIVVKNDEPTVVLKSLNEILMQYTSYYNGVVISHTIENSFYDRANEELVVAVKKQDFKPVFHEDVDHWLELLGGDALKDWVALYSDQTKQLSALVIIGAPGIGKGVLATGLKALNQNRFVESNQINTPHGRQNLVYSPLIVDDEGLGFGGSAVENTKTIRSLVGTSSFEANVKYGSKVIVNVNPRILITANNWNAIRLDGMVSNEDKEAVKQRFSIINATENTSAAEYLEQCDVGEWIARNKLAEHFTWLAKNRTITVCSGRFNSFGWDGLENEVENLSGQNQYMIQAICAHHLIYNSVESPQQGAIVLHNDKWYFFPSRLKERWNEYNPGWKGSLSTTKMNELVRPFVSVPKSTAKKINGQVYKGYELNVEAFKAALEYADVIPSCFVEAFGIESEEIKTEQMATITPFPRNR